MDGGVAVDVVGGRHALPGAGGCGVALQGFVQGGDDG